MHEILPGVFHWTSMHEGIHQRVHSYYVSGLIPAFLIDPRLPKEGRAWFDGRPAPEHIFLTNRHHYRHAKAFASAFGAEVWCNEKGLHEFTQDEHVRPFRHGDTLPAGVKALKVGALCDEETALYLPLHGGILAMGDAVIRERGRLSFVPDDLMGDDPELVKQGLAKVLRKHLREQSFKHLLLAHGEPVLDNANEALERFLKREESRGV